MYITLPSVFGKTDTGLTAAQKCAKIKYMQKDSDNLERLQDIYNNILLEERVRAALPRHWGEPEFSVNYENQQGALGSSGIDIHPYGARPWIKVNLCAFASSSTLELLMRHEIAHQVEMQRGERFNHESGYRAILFELYGNDHDYRERKSEAVEKRRKELDHRL